MLTEELRNLVIALGLTPASDDDTQLAQGFASGSFEPIVSGVPGGTETPVDDSDFTVRNGYYQRIGNICTVWIDIVFTNTNGSLTAESMLILPPFKQLSPVRSEVGPCQPNRRAATRQIRSFQFLTISAAPFDSRIIANDIDGATGAETQSIIIDNVERTIKGNITYWHTGEFNY